LEISMKTSTRKTHPISLGWLIVSAIIVLLGVTTAQADKLVGRPLPPQEIHDNHLDGAIASGGLLTVGVGEPVYLEAMIGMEPVVSGELDECPDRVLCCFGNFPNSHGDANLLTG
jgi:hypothetical protein